MLPVAFRAASHPKAFRTSGAVHVFRKDMRPVAWFRQPRSNADTSGARPNVSSIWAIWRRLAGCIRAATSSAAARVRCAPGPWSCGTAPWIPEAARARAPSAPFPLPQGVVPNKHVPVRLPAVAFGAHLPVEALRVVAAGLPDGVVLQRVPALHAPLALRAVAHLDVEAPHEGMHRRQVFLVLRRHTVQRDRAAAVRTARRGRRHVCLVSLRRLPAAPLPSVLRPGSPPGRPPRPCGRSLAKGAACRRPARRAASSSFSRCSLRRFQ